MTDKEIELALETIALVLEDLKKTQEKQQATITAIKEALAEHAMRETQRLGQEIEQEPVAYIKTVIEALYENSDPVSVEAAELLERITTPPQQELVCVCGAVWEGQELIYTTPQRKPLTKEQIEPMAIDVLGYGALLKEDMELFTEAVRAVEAAHGIKGGA